MPASVCIHPIPLGIDTCYLLRGEKTILIDGGAPGGLGAFLPALRRLGVHPREIELILVTHGHSDHIGALQGIQRLTGAQVAVHRNDRDWVESGRPPLPPGLTSWGKLLVGLGSWFYRPRIASCQVDLAFDDEGFSLAAYGIPGQVVHTPGHTAGSACVLLDTGEVFAGDTAMSAWFLRAKPGLAVLAEDRQMLVESWKKLIRMGARHVYPAHGADFPIEVIQKGNALAE